MRRRELLLAIVGAAAGTACQRHGAAANRESEVHRVVSLGPSTTESLFAIGAGDRVVGRSRYCDWPPEATRLPVVGGLEVDLEAGLQLRPDWVVGPDGGASQRFGERLRGYGIATFFPTIESLASIDGLLVSLGDRTGCGTNARGLVAELDARELEIARSVATDAKPRVLMVVGTAPVVAAGPKTFADDLLRYAGAINVVTAGPRWPVLSVEQIMLFDPDLVLDASWGEGGAAAISPRAQGWGALRAVRMGRVFPLQDPRALRPGPRIAEGLAVVARAVHPAATKP
jgi:iron complex transport system substrate-binding protein